MPPRFAIRLAQTVSCHALNWGQVFVTRRGCYPLLELADSPSGTIQLQGAVLLFTETAASASRPMTLLC